MAKELTEEQKKERSKAIEELVINCAEAGAKTFEDFLRENPNASLEEKHENLVKIIKSNFFITSLMVHGV